MLTAEQLQAWHDNGEGGAEAGRVGAALQQLVGAARRRWPAAAAAATLEPTSAHTRSGWSLAGYLVLEGFATAEEVAALKQRATQLVTGFRPEEHPQSVFSTRNQASEGSGAAQAR